MKSRLCAQLGIEFPLFAFSHCRDVVVEVSRAGGMGVLGAINLSPEQLDAELNWIDARVGGKPYGVDMIVPNDFEGKGEAISDAEVLAAVPEAHKDFAADVLTEYGISTDDLEAEREKRLFFRENLSVAGAEAAMDVAFSHPIGLIANALGVPPPEMIARGKANGVAVAALVGAREHALRQVAAGVDVIIAAGGEAGGHCGDVATMVLIPEVVEAVEAVSDVPVLAAGGIVTGAQMAAAMAMGAAGAWTGSVWLTTPEAETNPHVKEKMLAATSRDTVRSRSRTGKPSRQLRSPWTDAWDAGGPRPLPMPLQSLVAEPALHKVNAMAESGHAGAQALATYWVGQGVGLMNTPMGAGATVQSFKEDFLRGYERLANLLE